MPNPLTPEQAAERLRRVVEIGMAYLTRGSTEHKQFGIEAMLALLTDSGNVPAFRRRFRSPDNHWMDGMPL